MIADCAYPALVLNADFRPLSTSPLSTMSWKDALRAGMDGKFIVVEEYDGVVVRSPRMEFRLPSVVAVRTYVDFDMPAALTRWNVFLAHRFRCAMCGERFPSSELTFEHVIPRSKGGKSTWENLVPACGPCNSAKGDRTPKEAAKVGIVFRHLPYRPTRRDLNAIGIEFAAQEANATRKWMSWLYWKGVEIEP